tara:strand:- start:51 stop:629 length:579 start_codon:yes stop_codon:yes gene_type:complete
MLLNQELVIRAIFILFLFITFNKTLADNKGSETGLDLPRYVSLKSNESNIRVGPSKNYPISIKYITKDYPLKITDEYGDWRKIIDFQNNTGWVHKSLIKGERHGIIIGSNNKIDAYNTVKGKVIGKIDTGVVVKLSKCKINWCLIIKGENKGWVKKKHIWGVKKNEEFNIRFFQILNDYFIKSVNLIDDFLK